MNSLDGATVLVVDDEPDLCEMLAFEFRLQGSNVLLAGDGERAFELVRSQPIDAVVTDIQMAHGTGIELLDRIRERHSHEPVVFFITAYDTALSPMDAYDRGAEAIFGKPFRLKDLVDRVQRTLTEPQLRWAQPPQETPTETLAFQWSGLDEARDRKKLGLGRGGLAVFVDGCIKSGQLEPGCLVAIDMKFQKGPLRAIEGVGTVRWITEDADAEPACGIEFEYVSPSCLQPLAQWLETNASRPFIPRLG